MPRQLTNLKQNKEMKKVFFAFVAASVVVLSACNNKPAESTDATADTTTVTTAVETVTTDTSATTTVTVDSTTTAH